MTELRCASNSWISEPSFVMKDGTSPRFFMSIILNSAVDLAAIERRDCREKNLCCPIVKIDVHMPGEAGASPFLYSRGATIRRHPRLTSRGCSKNAAFAGERRLKFPPKKGFKRRSATLPCEKRF